MPTQLEKLRAAQEKAIQEKHEAAQREKRYKQQIADLERKQRTHRLCTRAAYLEKLLLEPEFLSDDDVFKFLDYVFNTPYVRDRLKVTLAAKHNEAESKNQVDTENISTKGPDVGTTENL